MRNVTFFEKIICGQARLSISVRGGSAANRCKQDSEKPNQRASKFAIN